MIKSKANPINWGSAGNGRYYSGVSNGSFYTFCTLYKRCTAAKSIELNALGIAQGVHYRTWSGVNALDVIEYVNNARGRGARSFNRCHHTVTNQAVNLPLGGIIANSPTSASQYCYHRQAIVSSVTPAVENHYTADLSAAQSRAWHAMQPEFSGNISMINFLFELTEVKALLRDALLACKHMSKLFSRLRSGKVPKVKDPTKPCAETWLQYQFGIKPLVSDLVQIGQQLYESVLSAQAQFQLDGLENNTRHYSEVFVSESTLAKAYGINSGFVNQTTFTATMDYSYDYSLRSPLEAIKRYWGLELSAEAIWNALPFSFLADYFFSIGKAISFMEHDSGVSLNLARYGESLKTEATTGVHVTVGSIQSWPICVDSQLVYSGTRLLSGTTSRLYTRYPSLPNKGVALPVSKHLNGKKMLNMAALLRCLL